jgi:tetratricopeptide (TPR) repeat protein
LALAIGKPEKALQYVGNALQIESDNPLFLVHKANCLQQLRRYPEALELTEKVEAVASPHAEVQTGLGTVYTGCGRHQDANRCYERAVALDPGNALNRLNLAASQRSLGELQAAESSYNKTLELNPSEYEAYLMRASLFRCTVGHNHIAQIRERLDQGVDHWLGEVQLCYALAKEYEDLAQYDAAFAAMKRGADLRRRNTEYDLGADIDNLQRISEVYDAARFQNPPPGYPAADAIFVVGLPRTGTTLVERILSSHSEVCSIGESTNFLVEMMKLAQAAEPGREGLIERSAHVDFRALGENYLASSRTQGATAPRFVDKQPANYLHCGPIHLALPNARIIVMSRGAMDSGLAMYKTLFKSACPFSYNLEELGRYFVAYRKLMGHWHSVLPGKILEVGYETLVSDPENESRRMFEFCGLNWEEQVLKFHDNPAAALTASAAQVRQPVYTSSVGKWRQFESLLEPLKRVLVDAGIPLD